MRRKSGAVSIVYSAQTSCRHEQARRKIGPLLCWQTGLGGRAAPRQDPSSTDSEALNGLIFWFEGYDYFRAPEWGVDGDTSTPARPSQCRWRLPQRVVVLLATHGALGYWEIGCPVLGGFRSRSELAACNALARKQASKATYLMTYATAGTQPGAGTPRDQFLTCEGKPGSGLLSRVSAPRVATSSHDGGGATGEGKSLGARRARLNQLKADPLPSARPPPEEIVFGIGRPAPRLRGRAALGPSPISNVDSRAAVDRGAALPPAKRGKGTAPASRS